MSSPLRRKISWRRLKERGSLLVFLAPFFVLLVVFKVAPLFINLVYSFMDLDLNGSGTFTGLSNYETLIHDELFFTSARNTFQYLLYVGPVNVVFGFLIALLLNTKIKGTTVGRTAVFMPYVMMVTLVGITWRWLLDGTNGLINHFLGYFGIGPLHILTQTDTAMVGIAVTSIWWTIGYNVIIYLAALQDIPPQLVEAAKIDGAGPLRRLFSITIPLMKRTTFYVVITTVIYSLQMFGQVYVMTAGGPSYATLSFVQYLYIKGFREFDLGYSSTIGVALFGVVAFCSVVIFLLFRETDGVPRRAGRKVAPR